MVKVGGYCSGGCNDRSDTKLDRSDLRRTQYFNGQYTQAGRPCFDEGVMDVVHGCDFIMQ